MESFIISLVLTYIVGYRVYRIGGNHMNSKRLCNQLKNDCRAALNSKNLSINRLVSDGSSSCFKEHQKF